jgi:hypothetical protein
MNLAAALLLTSALAMAETPASFTATSFTATTDNVAGAPDAIRIDVFRWSTAAERDQLLSAWNLTAPPASAGRGGGRGAGRGSVPDPAPDPAAVDSDSAPAPAPAGRGGRGGRGGRAGGSAAAPLTPERSLAAALGKAPIVGHLWSSEVAGYSIRYAAKIAESEGGERIILITDRRLGVWNDLWKPAGGGAAANYEFSVVEMHLNSKGEGEGKISLTGKIAVNNEEKSIALERFSELPVVLKNVRRGK